MAVKTIGPHISALESARGLVPWRAELGSWVASMESRNVTDRVEALKIRAAIDILDEMRPRLAKLLPVENEGT